MTIDQNKPITKTKNTIKNLLNKNDIIRLRKFIVTLPSADIADALELLEHKDILKFFRWLTSDKSSEIFTFLDASVQESIINIFTDKETESIIDDLFIDDIVDLIEEMPSNIVKKILRTSDKEVRERVNKILSYSEDSAGSLMSVNYVALNIDWNVERALAFIQENKNEIDSTELLFIVNNVNKLVGQISLKDLFFSQHDALLSTLNDQGVVFAQTSEDQEEIANQFKKYDIVLLPVVNDNHYLVGVITSDDVVDIIEEEATEDIQKLAGIQPTEQEYFKTSIFKMVRSRSVWLLFLMISATVSQIVINIFLKAYHADSGQDTSSLTQLGYIAIAYLVPLLPVISGTSGNAGSQSSTMVVRALSLKEIMPNQLGKVLWKELRIALLCGLILISVNLVRMVVIYYASPSHTINKDQWFSILALSIALYLTLIIAKLVGGGLPIIAKVLKMDPAIMAAPLLTTLVDALSTAIFFSSGLLIFSVFLHLN